MSRTGKKPIELPEKVKVTVADGVLLAEGPKGKESVNVHEAVKVNIGDKEITVEPVDGAYENRKYHGLMRSLIANAVTGVSTGFTRELDINGVGYRADVKGKALNLNLGFSHPVAHPIPDGIEVKVEKQTHLIVTGSNKELLGKFCSDVRGYRPPEPYKGKGVKYTEERIIRKVGKAAGGK